MLTGAWCSRIPRGAQGEDLISPEGQDLLLRMLYPDPSKRITVAQICQHPWFCCHLPTEALRTNNDCLRLSSELLPELWSGSEQQQLRAGAKAGSAVACLGDQQV